MSFLDHGVISPLIEIDEVALCARVDTDNMTDDDLCDHLRYFPDSDAKPRDDIRYPRSEALYDMETAALDRLHACVRVAPGVSVDTRRKVATALLAAATHLPIIRTRIAIPASPWHSSHQHGLTSPGPDQDLDEQVRETYAYCTSVDVVRECIHILLQDAAARGERDVSRELLRITCPDTNDVRSGHPVMTNVPLWRLETAQDMVNRAGEEARLDRLDGVKLLYSMRDA